MTLHINLLGEFSVFKDGEKCSLIKSKRTRALMAYLIASNRPQRRESLCDCFWDDHNDPKGALRWSLSKIRNVLNDDQHTRLIADREKVQFSSENIVVDTHHIKKLLEQASLSIQVLKECADKLALTFLEGIEISEQSGFQRWLTAERLETETCYLQTLKRLWEHADSTASEKLAYIKMALTKDLYNTNICTLLIKQLRAMGLHSELSKTIAQVQQRFQDAGIKWQIEVDTQSNTVLGNTVLRNQEADIKAANRELLMRQQVKFCKTKDNTRIAYACVGEGYPIVKTANWLTHLEYDWNAPIWSPLFRQLASKHRVIRYDERGNGLSDWQVKDLSFNAFVDDLETVVDETKLEKFALMGISQGASVSIEYAIKHPEKVSHLILFGAYAAGWRINATADEIKRREAIMTLTEAGWGQDNPAYRQIFSSTFLPSANKEELDWFNEFQRQTTSPENAARFLSVFGDIDVRDQLAKVKVPTLVIHSMGDQRIPMQTGQDIAAQIPNAEFVGLDSDSHLLLGREPASDAFVETVKDFIARN